ncbi:leucine-rich repeat and immunoglobulin-like domain-containing nogo receptor-interacting protein 2 [Branchiostoma floridae]|uniref:Leucine-rich repeat and immunoglobulin-like domain-containing nogo receptor-interacting protein 2 n=1 Tax=Branchiostoma floridae TaxID=7739 RepID=A0A9J7MLI3_BRAFL|nr:leucine-rich repeat and immunoglobulin-like domain-containing nogo receptor-interacting protein 2 [Branchiostoma floridae]
MGRRLKHMLIFLLIILKEFHMPEASCSCSPSSCSCESLGLTSVPQNLSTSITSLILGYNQITTLGQSDFSRYTNLINLYLNNNDISGIEAVTFRTTPQLQRLYLNGNNLTSIPQGVFNNLTQIQRLYLSSNLITHIQPGAFSNLPQLKQLHLQHNKLTSIPTVQYQFPELAYLYLYNNNITDIPANAFSNQPKLSYLYLHSNRISTVSSTAFRGLVNLSTLDLHNNELTELPVYLFFGLSSLNNLKLQNNAILQIFPNTFTGLSSLTYLYLFGNNIETFPIEALLKISSNTQLYLQNNQMTTLSFTAYDKLSSVRTVYINNNPWQCDCRMVAFRLKMNGSHSFENQITCTDPQKSGQLLKDINPEDLTCEEPKIVRFEMGDENLVVEGGTLRLVCEASGIPTPDITVTLPSGLNVTDESGGRVTVDVNGTITVTDVTAADAGLYICIAASPVGSMFETLSVDVQPKVPPTVTMAPLNITDNPESTSNHGSAPSFSLPVLLGSVIGAVAGTVLIVGIILMIWCKRRTQHPPPSGPDTSVVFSNTDTTVTVATSGHDQTGQGQSQNVRHPQNAQRPTVPQLPIYEDVDQIPSNQRHAAGPTSASPGGAGPRGAGPRGAGPRGANPRGESPSRGASPGGVGPRGASPRDTSPRGASPRGAGPTGESPRGAGPRQLAKKMPPNRNKAPNVEHPPPPPPHTGAAAAVYANEPDAPDNLHLYQPLTKTY